MSPGCAVGVAAAAGAAELAAPTAARAVAAPAVPGVLVGTVIAPPNAVPLCRFVGKTTRTVGAGMVATAATENAGTRTDVDSAGVGIVATAATADPVMSTPSRTVGTGTKAAALTVAGTTLLPA
jgi:hypothetical protein